MFIYDFLLCNPACVTGCEGRGGDSPHDGLRLPARAELGRRRRGGRGPPLILQWVCIYIFVYTYICIYTYTYAYIYTY